MTTNDFKNLTSTCWNGKYQRFAFDMTKDRYQSRYRLNLYSIFVPNSSPFQNKKMSIYSNVTAQDSIDLRELEEQQKNQRALKIKNRILKQTHHVKLAERLSPITTKIDIFN